MLRLDLGPQPIAYHPQAWAPHAMQFPAELTKAACVTSQPAELRLICIYFFTAHLFQVSSKWPSRLLYYWLAGGVDQLTVHCSRSLPLWAPLTLSAFGRDKSNLRKSLSLLIVSGCSPS